MVFATLLQFHHSKPQMVVGYAKMVEHRPLDNGNIFTVPPEGGKRLQRRCPVFRFLPVLLVSDPGQIVGLDVYEFQFFFNGEVLIVDNQFFELPHSFFSLFPVFLRYMGEYRIRPWPVLGKTDHRDNYQQGCQGHHYPDFHLLSSCAGVDDSKQPVKVLYSVR